MTVWAVGSLRGAPGATTLAMGLAAAWPATTGRRCVVVEADPNGGVLAARFDELRADRTIADASSRTDYRNEPERTQVLDYLRLARARFATLGELGVDGDGAVSGVCTIR